MKVIVIFVAFALLFGCSSPQQRAFRADLRDRLRKIDDCLLRNICTEEQRCQYHKICKKQYYRLHFESGDVICRKRTSGMDANELLGDVINGEVVVKIEPEVDSCD